MQGPACAIYLCSTDDKSEVCRQLAWVLSVERSCESVATSKISPHPIYLDYLSNPCRSAFTRLVEAVANASVNCVHVVSPVILNTYALHGHSLLTGLGATVLCACHVRPDYSPSPSESRYLNSLRMAPTQTSPKADPPAPPSTAAECVDTYLADNLTVVATLQPDGDVDSYTLDIQHAHE